MNPVKCLFQSGFFSLPTVSVKMSFGFAECVEIRSMARLETKITLRLKSTSHSRHLQAHLAPYVVEGALGYPVL